MKKAFFVIALLVMGILFASCASESISPTRGIWDDDTYTSAYFGLRFDLPEGWVAITEEMDENLGPILTFDRNSSLVNNPMIPFGEIIPPEAFESIGHFIYEVARDRNNSGSMMLLISEGKIYPFAPPRPTRQSHGIYLGDIFDIVLHDDVIRLGNLEWQVADFTDKNSGEIAMRYIANMDGEFMRMIRIYTLSNEQLDDIMAHFRPY